MMPVFFPDAASFRRWLEVNHQTEKEIVVGYYKISTGKCGLTWSASVDEALCFGWIDGIRKSVDANSYCIRFTPRNPKSIWSKVNIEKAEKLISEGKMQPAGLVLYQQRKEDKSVIYSYENKPAEFPPDMEQQFKQHEPAWLFFTTQPPYYQKTMQHWVLSAKQPKTQVARLQKLIAASQNKQRLT
ncbi:MAG TPA: YdeI/OmpD-associated family protein [Chitinophagales bacterium]|nr:YdeI/OmpD-associated family protein [Chitinophagales bacterium]HRK29056.1 YdeI/OmpD-associated family protein [Chitinophagales bacterium]